MRRKREGANYGCFFGLVSEAISIAQLLGGRRRSSVDGDGDLRMSLLVLGSSQVLLQRLTHPPTIALGDCRGDRATAASLAAQEHIVLPCFDRSSFATVGK